MKEEEAQKMAALKKAYADVILNTAKEAASRILISERKALRFQQDLHAAKEEALSMLLRVKQVMDSKIAEAERASLIQREKVQELEAQLNEAEEKVVDLRIELRRAQDELEKIKYNLSKPMDEQVVEGIEHVTSNALSGALNQRCGGCTFFMLENITSHRTSDADNLPRGIYCEGSTDLGLIEIREQETDPYFNGSTQNIHPEQSLLMGSLSLHRQNGDGCSDTKADFIFEDHEIMKQNGTSGSPNAESMKLPNEMVEFDGISEKGGIVRFFRRAAKRERSNYGYTESTPCRTTDNTVEAQVSAISVPFSDAILPCSCNNVNESDETQLKLIGKDVQKDSNSSSPICPKDTEVLDDRKDCVVPYSEAENDDPNSRDHFPAVNAEDNMDDAKALIEESLNTRYEQKLPDSSDASTSVKNLEIVTGADNPDSKDEIPCAMIENTAKTANARLLKYTFRRKRKRIPSGSHNDECPIEKKSTAKRYSGDKQCSMPEPKKPTLESTRDNRRMVQVARQLVSLSAKGWS